MKLKLYKFYIFYVDDNINFESELELFIDIIEEVNFLIMDEWKEIIFVNNVFVKFQLDIGVKCNVMFLVILKVICSEFKIWRKDVLFKLYFGYFIKFMGIIFFICCYRD